MSLVRMPNQKDKLMGLRNEKEVIPKVNESLGRYYVKTSDEYCGYDAEDKKGNRLEIKSRTNDYNQYPTTLIPAKKVLHKGKGDLHFVFRFRQGDIYIIKYDKEKFEKFDIFYAYEKRYDKIIVTPNYQIPIRSLHRLR